MNKIQKAVKDKLFFYRINKKISSIVIKFISSLKISNKIKFELSDYIASVNTSPKLLSYILNQMNVDFFIQIGIGNVDNYKDPFFNFTKEKKGILIEANPLYIDKIKKFYNSQKILNYFVDSKEEEAVKLYYVKNLNEYRSFAKGICSSSKNHLLKHGILPKDISFHDVKSKNLISIIKENNIKKIDLLIIDVEGNELNIINDFIKNSDLTPNIIFEYKHLQFEELKKTLKHLEEKDYKIYFFKSDIVCINKDTNL